jgi:hypothetical protein
VTASDPAAGGDLDLSVGDRAILERRIRGLVTPALVAEHRERPFGPHSPELVELMHFLRRNVARNRPRYVCLCDGEPPVWRVGAAAAGARAFEAVDDTPYERREDAEHAVFRRRLSDLGLS